MTEQSDNPRADQAHDLTLTAIRQLAEESAEGGSRGSETNPYATLTDLFAQACRDEERHSSDYDLARRAGGQNRRAQEAWDPLKVAEGRRSGLGDALIALGARTIYLSAVRQAIANEQAIRDGRL